MVDKQRHHSTGTRAHTENSDSRADLELVSSFPISPILISHFLVRTTID